MWRDILWFLGQFAAVIVFLTILFWMNALPDTRFIPVIVAAYLFLASLGRKLDKVDKNLETLAKKLNVNLEEAPAKAEKKIILTE
jgi:hypothetical protein